MGAGSLPGASDDLEECDGGGGWWEEGSRGRGYVYGSG